MIPSLDSLQQGGEAAWDAAFDWLWPTAFAVAQLKLQPFVPEDIEDVAIESLEELVDKVRSVRTVEELKPLAASIAHHRAVSRLRERFAQKRGAGQVESLDKAPDDDCPPPEPAAEEGALARLDERELTGLLAEMGRELKPELRDILEDFFLSGLSYEQIAAKRGVALGTVGVYLKRGLEALRKAGERQPKLLKELEAFLR
jgi:RNA polymerase sigma factor (sigma-70 family)